MVTQSRFSPALLWLCSVALFAGCASAKPNDGIQGLNEEPYLWGQSKNSVLLRGASAASS